MTRLKNVVRGQTNTQHKHACFINKEGRGVLFLDKCVPFEENIVLRSTRNLGVCTQTTLIMMCAHGEQHILINAPG